ncbi:unnamed protein product [Alternaria alternata]
MQEAQAANQNASNLAHITNLTMLFIPLSTIAAIFSMDDKFLPGKTKGWIFWSLGNQKTYTKIGNQFRRHWDTTKRSLLLSLKTVRIHQASATL